MNDAALDREEQALSGIVAATGGVPSVQWDAKEILEAIRELRAECRTLRWQRDRTAGDAVRTYQAFSGFSEAFCVNAVREGISGIDPSESARLAAIVFDEPEGE